MRTRKTLTMVAALGLAGITTFVLVGGVFGAILAVVGSFAGYRFLRRLEARGDQTVALRVEAELPFALSLLAAVLRTGCPVSGAVSAVATALGPGPVATWWRVTAAALRLGATPIEAWRKPDELPELVEPVCAAMIRSAASGAALANACERLANRMRETAQARSVVAMRRASVLTVLPLATCLLPAFVLWGVVPIVVDLLSDVTTLAT